MTLLFAPTADQRFLLGSDVFLRTHFPMKLLGRQGSQLSLMLEENEFLARLLKSPDAPGGNRVWIV